MVSFSINKPEQCELTYHNQQQQRTGASNGHGIRGGQQPHTTQHIDGIECSLPVGASSTLLRQRMA